MTTTTADPFSPTNGFGEEYKPTAINLLRDTIALLDANKILHSLIAGTLLGKVRHNDFIPWDDDMDMIVSADIFDKLPEMRQLNPHLIFIERQQFLVKICYRPNPSSDHHVKTIKNHGLDRFMNSPTDAYTFPFIDLFIYQQDPSGRNLHFFKKEWDATKFLPFKKTMFCNIVVNIPRVPHYFLDKNYGNNYMRVLKSSNWDHKNECAIKKEATINLISELPYHI